MDKAERGGINRLRLRLTAASAISAGLVLLGMVLVPMRVSTMRMEEQYWQRFRSEVNNVFFYLRGQATLDHIWLSDMEKSGGLLIEIDFPGQELFWNSSKPEKTVLARLAAQAALESESFDYTMPPSSSFQADAVFFPLTTENGSYHTAVAVVPVQKSSWVQVVILKHTVEEQAALRNTRLLYAGVFLLALLCLALAAWFFSAWAVKPAVESRRRQAEFIAAASHELRSPLAVMQASAGAIRCAPPEQWERFAGKIDMECGRMARLTEDLLLLAGTDGKALPLAMALSDPQTILLSAGERFEELAAEKGIALEISLPEEALPVILCDEQRIQQVLSILLDNALRYTPEGGRIGLSARRERQMLCFSVEDSGPGIPQEERERIFHRFYRGDRSRSGKEHYGLGLSIAREIARLHRGELVAGQGDRDGAVFTLTLPVRK